MKKVRFALLAFLSTAALLATATSAVANPIPTDQLGTYFTNNGIEYFTVPTYYGYGGTGDYLFVPTRDPQDAETIGVFFELNTGNSLNGSGMHWAIGLRGPRSGSPLDNYAGRGLALGEFGVFDYCNGFGGFIEDFTAAKTGGELQLTYCQTESLANYTTYRIDIHVSKLNVYTVVWRKLVLPYVGTVYIKEAEYSCVSDAGPGGPAGYCPENPLDSNHGGVFIGSAFLPSGYNWTASSIHVAFF